MAHPRFHTAALLRTALLAVAAPASVAASSEPRAGVQPVAMQTSIHERIIIRVPRMLRRSQPQPGRVPMSVPRRWKEHKGPKCIVVGDVAGAVLRDEQAVDLLMNDGRRLRAKLDGDCRPLDYYSSFYLRPGEDGLICRDRDAIRMRSGGSCEIDDFKTLTPKR